MIENKMIGQQVKINGYLRQAFVNLNSGESVNVKYWAEKNGATLIEWSDVDDTAQVEILIKNQNKEIFTVYKGAINNGEFMASIDVSDSMIIAEASTSKVIKQYVIEKMQIEKNQDRISNLVENILLSLTDFENFLSAKSKLEDLNFNKIVYFEYEELYPFIDKAISVYAKEKETKYSRAWWTDQEAQRNIEIKKIGKGKYEGEDIDLGKTIVTIDGTSFEFISKNIFDFGTMDYLLVNGKYLGIMQKESDMNDQFFVTNEQQLSDEQKLAYRQVNSSKFMRM